jgi:hypothetical protein
MKARHLAIPLLLIATAAFTATHFAGDMAYFVGGLLLLAVAVGVMAQ